MAITLSSVLGKSGYVRQTDDTDYRSLVADLIKGATRALNAYADNAGKPTVSYVIQSRTADYGATADEVEEMARAATNPMQKGRD